MRTDLLRTHVQTMRLRQSAPFPSQVSSTRELIDAWRREQRMRLVPPRAHNGERRP